MKAAEHFALSYGNSESVRSRPDTTGSRASRPVDSDDVETRRNPRASAQRAPLDRTNNLRVARPTGREHTQRTLTDSATSEHPPLGRTNGMAQHMRKAVPRKAIDGPTWCACTAPPARPPTQFHRPVNSERMSRCSCNLWSKAILTIWSKPSCSHLSVSERRTAHA